MNKLQRGFMLMEVILIILILVIVGFGGYYVWHTHSNKQSAATTNQTASTAKPAANNSTTSQDTLTFKEIGVKITVPPSLKGLAYTTDMLDGTLYLNLYTPAFENALHRCDPTTANSNTSAFVSIAKNTGQYEQDATPGVGNLKQFPTFWVSAASPNGIVCADSASQQDMDDFQNQFSQSNAAIQNAFESATLAD